MSRVSVVLGVHDRITMDYGKARLYNVSKSIVHPKHIDRHYYDENDIALLKVNRQIIFDSTIRPVCLPYASDDFTRRVAVVAGWGRKYENGFTDRYLQKTTVEILPDSDCSLSKIGNLFNNIQDQVLCAYQRNTDSCQGDSGGPLTTNVDKNLMVQIGIVSFGKLCGDHSSPGVYSKITHYLSWIIKMTEDSEYCKKPIYHPAMSDSNRLNIL